MVVITMRNILNLLNVPISTYNNTLNLKLFLYIPSFGEKNNLIIKNRPVFGFKADLYNCNKNSRCGSHVSTLKVTEGCNVLSPL